MGSKVHDQCRSSRISRKIVLSWSSFEMQSRGSVTDSPKNDPIPDFEERKNEALGKQAQKGH